ncbi:hypothetical protein EZ428_05000 [Pedobacter frigiditerrae]|uniref:LPS export ABC transporter protein LptC n=1 Tax=Pedobacter frigiditerrae TaxID=2530452 RepID=A0A4R0N2S0_9SPHI|nr:hypothetical protein [Pedobacter frigiditerrae]TCC94138.1 hypothetical protein EZ428_05000 [Pedobacter frigiditerrae]
MKASDIKSGLKLTFTIALLLVMSSCNDDDMKNVSAVSSKQITLSKDRTYGAEIIYSDSAKVKGKGYAPIYDKVVPSQGASYNEMPSGVKIEFFDEFLKTTGTIKSDYAINKETEKITIFRRNVIIVTDKITFTTEELTWDENKRMYFSPSGTVTTKDGNVLNGTEFSAPQDLSTYKIKDASGQGNVKGDLLQ